MMDRAGYCEVGRTDDGLENGLLGRPGQARQSSSYDSNNKTIQSTLFQYLESEYLDSTFNLRV